MSDYPRVMLQHFALVFSLWVDVNPTQTALRFSPDTDLIFLVKSACVQASLYSEHTDAG